jgi:hypothetical protein
MTDDNITSQQREIAEAYKTGRLVATPTVTGVTGGLGLPPGSGPAPGPTVSPVTDGQTLLHERISRLVWSGEVPHQKWMNFYTKVLSKFAATAGLRITLRVEVAPVDGVSPQKVDETKVALRELGLKDLLEGE